MDLSQYQRMDPAMLYSLLNMKLRNDYRDLDDLARSLNLDGQALTRFLAGKGYE